MYTRESVWLLTINHTRAHTQNVTTITHSRLVCASVCVYVPYV